MAITGNSIDLVWTAATDDIAVTDYKIYKSNDGITYDSGTSVGNVLAYTYPGLSSDTQYWFKLTALDAALNESVFSNVVTDTTLAYLLDTYTGAAAAYSLRKLRTGETYAVEVRRSSDNATTDVELEDSGSITLSSTVSAGGTLGTWVGSNSAYVRTWYDQSGNGNDVTQATTTLQPRLINAGTLNILNSSASISFTGALRRLNIPSALYTYPNNTNKSVFTVGNTNNNTTRQRALTFAVSSTSNLGLWYEAGSGVVSWTSNGYGNRVEVTSTTTSQILLTGISVGTSNSIFANGTSGGTNSLGGSVSGTTNAGIGNYSATTNDPLDGNYQEIIIYPSDQSSNRTAIETDINNHYSIF